MAATFAAGAPSPPPAPTKVVTIGTNCDDVMGETCTGFVSAALTELVTKSD